MEMKEIITNAQEMKNIYSEKRDFIKMFWINVLEKASRDLGIDYLSFEELEDTKIAPSDKVMTMESLLVTLDSLTDFFISLGNSSDLSYEQINHLLVAYWIPFSYAYISLADKERTIKQLNQTVENLKFSLSSLEANR